jgi:hypothetical protein
MGVWNPLCEPSIPAHLAIKATSDRFLKKERLEGWNHTLARQFIDQQMKRVHSIHECPELSWIDHFQVAIIPNEAELTKKILHVRIVAD